MAESAGNSPRAWVGAMRNREVRREAFRIWHRGNPISGRRKERGMVGEGAEKNIFANFSGPFLEIIFLMNDVYLRSFGSFRLRCCNKDI